MVFWHGTSGDDEGFNSLPITDASKHSSRSRRIRMEVLSACLITFPNFRYCWSWLSTNLLGILCGARAAVGIENRRSSQNSPDWKIFRCGFQAQGLPQSRGEELLCASPLPGSLEAHKWSVGRAGLVCPPDSVFMRRKYSPLWWVTYCVDLPTLHSSVGLARMGFPCASLPTTMQEPELQFALFFKVWIVSTPPPKG